MIEPRDEPPVREQTALGSYIAQATNNSTASVNVYEDVRPRPVEHAVITAAHERLAQLPLKSFPMPAAQPVAVHSRLPVFERNPLFVGRQADLQAIAQALKAEEPVTVVISGMGGMGKTQLVSEVIFRYGGYFAGGVFWLNFADITGIPSEIAACRTALQEELRLDLHTLPLEEQVIQILAAWQSDLPRLLIFDNCEEEALLATWRPPLGGCRILVTSRRATWDSDLHVHHHALSDLKRPESIELLGKYRPDLTTEERNNIAEVVGDLPLALHLAGNYLEEYRESRLGRASAYLKALSNMPPLQHPSLQAEGSTYTTRHIRDVARTFALSYERLDEKDPVDALAISLLAHAAYFAPGVAIPRELLRATMGPEEDDVLEDRCVRALKRLAGLGLLETFYGAGEVSYRLHQLLASFIRLQPATNTPEVQTTVEKVVETKASLLYSTGHPVLLQTFLPHLRFITNEAYPREDAMVAALCDTLGTHLDKIGAYTEAVSYLKQALTISTRVLGPEHPDTATSLNNLASLYEHQGKYEQAEPLYQRALTIWEQVLGPEHPQTATGLNNLAGLYASQGKYEQAKPLFQRALAICEQVLGPEHPQTATGLNNLAALYASQGKYEQATLLYQRALAICEQVLGPEHPTTATSVNNLATLYASQGKYEQAEPLYQRALTICEQVLGPEHPDTATSLNNLADLYEKQGKYEQAEPLFQRVLATREQVLGPEHPSTATNLNSLASLYTKQGKYEQAEPLFQRALTICEQVLGPEHPDTATSLNNLANLYVSQGKYEQTEPLFQRALAIREQVHGPEHPDTTNSLNSLAHLYSRQGKYEQAEPLYQHALAIREQVLGPEHPTTATSVNNLALLYMNQGKYEQAKPLFQRALAIREQVLGPEHPDIAISLNNLALLYARQGKYEQAEPLFQRALAIREQVHGPEHPDTATSLINLASLYVNQGKYEQAEPLFQRALTICEQVLGPKHPQTATNLNNLAALYARQGKYEQAEPLFQRALAICEQVLGPKHPQTATSLFSLANLYRIQKSLSYLHLCCHALKNICQNNKAVTF
ncbi:hypothetical protein KSC_012120 [Ktedonobacter sp. SOSP1-52]|uniref:tetratricopeptide repeat protein n=1 Tax=Ktedonobacter sp. SOSP1-52 TaxID=2778366 RepID=UPI0019156596|nr:tetratricopeptide repeat protein [Ktedonobacter sp. SOSP1-52]GHO62320.1 hypothetical protein KSC_012120 [Ktedonobacter sp. SOSP1-52]